MGRLFPRTSLAAAVQSASFAARSAHDEHVGVGERAHLFRCFSPLEEGIVEALADPGLQEEIRAALGSESKQDALLAKLAGLVGGRKSPAAEGPVCLGEVTRLTEAAAVAELAAHYHAAAKSGAPRYPYFAAASAVAGAAR